MKNTYYIISLLLLTSCYTSQYFTKQTKMKYFNIEKFEKNAKGTYSTGLDYEYENFGTVITQTGAKLKSGTTYQENFRKKHSPITDWYEYDEKGRLRRSGTDIYNGNAIGFYREYDENGKMILEENEEKPYKLSYEDIRKIVLERYKRDIFDYRQDTEVNRGVLKKNDRERPYYNVIIIHRGDDGYIISTDGYILNAETGKDFDEKQSEPKKSTSSLTNSQELGTAYSSNKELTSDKNIYQVYDGRYYTKPEWEEFQKTLPWLERLFMGKS